MPDPNGPRVQICDARDTAEIAHLMGIPGYVTVARPTVEANAAWDTALTIARRWLTTLPVESWDLVMTNHEHIDSQLVEAALREIAATLHYPHRCPVGPTEEVA